MCITFLSTDPNPPKGGYRLIIASNRDEFYRRPAKTAFLCPETMIIGGRDVEPGREGGMWLGVSMKPQTIKFAALLNVTGEKKKPTSSGRGPLVYDYLKSDEGVTGFVRTLQNRTYTAFNLLMMEITRDTSCVYHHSNSPEATLEYRGKQILSFSNSTPDKPLSKVRNGQEVFMKIVKESKDKNELIEELLGLLKCEDLHLPDPELERRAPAGVNFLSAIFVKMADVGYGTRTHSVILVDDECNIEFIEHTMREPIDHESPIWDATVIKSQL